MNQRKIERVAEAAGRHGWFAATVDELKASAAVRSVDPLEVLWPDFGLLAVVAVEGDVVTLRRRRAWGDAE